jgi:hypothetical protein
MRGGALPPALLFAALGLALAFAPRRAYGWAILAMVLPALAVSFVPIGTQWADAMYMGCWISLLVAALSVHLPRSRVPWLMILLALDVGFWGGAVIAVSGKPLDLALSAPWVLLAFPGEWLVRTKRQIAVKVLASWLVAVALLSATLQVTTPTPGYVPDHMD